MLSYNKHEATNKEICEERLFRLANGSELFWTTADALNHDRKIDRDPALGGILIRKAKTEVPEA